MIQPKVYTALVTPCDASGNLCINTLIAMCSFQKKSGVAGVILFGTTGEGFLYSHEEKKRALASVAFLSESSFLVVVSVSAMTRRETLDLCHMSQLLGINHCMLSPPPYVCAGEDSFFYSIEKIVSLGMVPLVYNHPVRTGQSLSSAFFDALSELSILGVKDARETKCIQELVDQGINYPVYSGNDFCLLQDIASGASGVVSVISNSLPKEVVQMVLSKRSDSSVTKVLKDLESYVNPVGIKKHLQKEYINMYLRDPYSFDR